MTYSLVVGAAPEAGEEGFYRALLTDAAFVVAADAAGEWCVALDRVPDVIVGDFDSSDLGARDRLAALGAEVIAFPQDKDETDLELAADVACARCTAPIVFTAAFSRRLDHTLAALGALTRAGSGARVLEPHWSAFVCAPGADLNLDPPEGTVVSVIATGDAAGVTVSGMKWPLEGATLAPLSGLGVSNRACGGTVCVSTQAGTLIVFVQGEVDGAIY